MVTLQTPRLVLRPFEASDAQPLLDTQQDPEIIKYSLMRRPLADIIGSWRVVAAMIGHWHLRRTMGRRGEGDKPDHWPKCNTRDYRVSFGSASARSVQK